MWRSSTLWGTFSVEMAKGSEGMERPFNGGLRNWWRDQHIYKAESVTLKVKREEVVSHVWWAWNQENVQLLKRWRDHLLRLTFRPRMRTGEDWVGAACDEGPVEGNGPSEHELSLEKVQRKCALAPSACHGTDKVVQTQAKDPTNATRWKHRWGYHNKGSSGTLRLRNGLRRRIGCLNWIKNRLQKKDLVKKFLMQVGEPVEPVAETEGGGHRPGNPESFSQWDGHMETGGPKERGRWK